MLAALIHAIIEQKNGGIRMRVKEQNVTNESARRAAAQYLEALVRVLLLAVGAVVLFCFFFAEDESTGFLTECGGASRSVCKLCSCHPNTLARGEGGATTKCCSSKAEEAADSECASSSLASEP